jgi:poly(A) polymerase
MAVRVPDQRFVDPFGGLADLRPGACAHRSTPGQLRRRPAAHGAPGAVHRDARRATRRRDAKAATAMAERLTRSAASASATSSTSSIVGTSPAGAGPAVDTGLADRFLPEVPALRMQRDPAHHHKDVYRHTLAVVEGCPADDRSCAWRRCCTTSASRRPGSSMLGGKVSFHHHDVVGARMARAATDRAALPHARHRRGLPPHRLHLRFHGYATREWTDSGVRRYVRDAGSDEQLARLNRLTRADVTTRTAARRSASSSDGRSRGADRPAPASRRSSRIRPALDGNAIMAHLGLPPGRSWARPGRCFSKRAWTRGPMTEEEARARLDRWAAERGLGQ